MKFPRIARVFLLMVVGTLSGCGQKGPLTLDGQPSTPLGTQLPESEEEQEEESSGDGR